MLSTTGHRFSTDFINISIQLTKFQFTHMNGLLVKNFIYVYITVFYRMDTSYMLIKSMDLINKITHKKIDMDSDLQ